MTKVYLLKNGLAMMVPVDGRHVFGKFVYSNKNARYRTMVATQDMDYDRYYELRLDEPCWNNERLMAEGIKSSLVNISSTAARLDLSYSTSHDQSDCERLAKSLMKSERVKKFLEKKRLAIVA